MGSFSCSFKEHEASFHHGANAFEMEVYSPRTGQRYLRQKLASIRHFDEAIVDGHYRDFYAETDALDYAKKVAVVGGAGVVLNVLLQHTPLFHLLWLPFRVLKLPFDLLGWALAAASGGPKPPPPPPSGPPGPLSGRALGALGSHVLRFGRDTLPHVGATLRDVGGSAGATLLDVGGKTGAALLDVGGKTGAALLDVGGKTGAVLMDVGGKTGAVLVDVGGKTGAALLDVGGKTGAAVLDFSVAAGAAVKEAGTSAAAAVQDAVASLPPLPSLSDLSLPSLSLPSFQLPTGVSGAIDRAASEVSSQVVPSPSSLSPCLTARLPSPPHAHAHARLTISLLL